MKRFISAISSLVIAATAMGGTFALSTDAATNGTVDKTIIEFTTEVGGQRVSEVTAKAGDTLPIKIYVPQSSGINTLALKMTINGDATLGQGTVEYPALDSETGKSYYATEEGAKHKGDAGKVATNEYLFGNYGITMDHKGGTGYANPYCFDSGFNSTDGGYGDGSSAGSYSNAGTVPFTDYAMNINWMHKDAVQHKANIDAYAPAKAFLDAADDITDVDYNGYTPITTWTKDESWAYTYAFAETNLVLPADLPDGTYVLDVFKDTYVNSGSIFDADLKDPTKLKVTTTNSSVAGVDGKANYETVPLTITVGEAGQQTTTTPKQTDTPAQTTTTPKQTDPPTSDQTDAPYVEDVPAGTIVFNFVPDGKEYTKGATNRVNVAKGEQVTANLVVSNDPGTAGMQLYFSFDPALTFVRRKNSKAAYDVSVTWNPDDYSYVFTTADGKNQTAADGSVMSGFIFTMPETDGEYTIDLNENAPKPNSVRDQAPVTEKEDTPYIFHGLTFVVGDVSDETTAAPILTTEQPPVTTTEQPPVTTTEQPPVTTTEPPVSETTPEVVVGDAVWGDVNCDGDVRINDVVLLNKYLAGNATPSAQGLINADVNHSDSPDTKDSVKIKAYLAQLIEKTQLAVKGDYTAK